MLGLIEAPVINETETIIRMGNSILVIQKNLPLFLKQILFCSLLVRIPIWLYYVKITNPLMQKNGSVAFMFSYNLLKDYCFPDVLSYTSGILLV